MVKLQPGQTSETLIRKGLSQFFGDGYSTGIRETPSGNIHMIRRAALTQEDPEFSEMVWRVRDDRFELAPNETIFTAVDEARRSGRTNDNADIFTRSTRSLHEKSSFMVILNPFRGPWALNPWVQIMTERLHGNFRFMCR